MSAGFLCVYVEHVDGKATARYMGVGATAEEALEQMLKWANTECYTEELTPININFYTLTNANILINVSINVQET